MSELGNPTYSIALNNKIFEELEALRNEVSQIRGSQLINEAWVDCKESRLGGMIAKRVEEQYKKLLEKEAAKEKSYDNYLKEWKTIISETSLGKKVCCGFSVGTEVEQKPPHFIVQDGQVYINQSGIKDATNQSNNYKEECSGWKLGVNGKFELNTKTSKVLIDNEVLELFDKNGTLRVRVQL